MSVAMFRSESLTATGRHDAPLADHPHREPAPGAEALHRNARVTTAAPAAASPQHASAAPQRIPATGEHGRPCASVTPTGNRPVPPAAQAGPAVLVAPTRPLLP